MKRQKIYFIVACLLAILAIVAIIYQKGGFRKSYNTQKMSTLFAIKDTSTITRIFMADMFGNKVLLSRDPGGWLVNNRKPASSYQINDLLAMLTSIRIAQPVAGAAQRSIIEVLAINSTKVEIYGMEPLFRLFRHPFFTKERLLKTYFLGDATQNNLGSYAILEGMSAPYIIYKPGFRGYITPVFSPDPLDWYSQCVFSTKLTRIQNGSFIDLENPENSFFIEKAGPRTFTLFDIHKNIILDYDTLLLINMLSEFRERNYEKFLSEMSQPLRDSIIQSYLYKVISITDVEDQTTTMKLYHKIEVMSLYDEDDNLIEETHYVFNRDRSYATINDNTDEMFTIQFFHFDRQIQPLSYYLKK